MARIDLIGKSDVAITITDLKTARFRWRAGQVEDSSEQLLLYGELAPELGRGETFAWNLTSSPSIAKAVNPVVERLPVNLDAGRVFGSVAHHSEIP